jgi:hypothetical protein
MVPRRSEPAGSTVGPVKRGALAGVIAGAVGTLALDVVSYGDMLLQGRAASSLPGQAARRLASTVGLRFGLETDPRTRNRESALGALLGYGTGVAVGGAYGLLARNRPARRATGIGIAGAAMLLANGPMVAQGLTDPRAWGLKGWVSDIVPHLAYGWATVATYRAITA